MPKVLIIEDDEAMARALEDGFGYEGLATSLARDGVEGLKLASREAADLIILDVMLPKLSGLDVLKRIRSEGNLVPIILLTARSQDIDKVMGLRLGADDYVTKPFSFLELMARVEAVLRRSTGYGDKLDAYVFGDVSVDFKLWRATKAERELELTPREFRLLHFFIERRGQVLAREQLLEAVWGYQGRLLTRTVDMHVAKLRKKIEDRPADPRHIVTIHRVGYKFTA